METWYQGPRQLYALWMRKTLAGLHFFSYHRLRLILFAELFSFATNIRYHCPSKRAVMEPGVGLLEGMS